MFAWAGIAGLVIGVGFLVWVVSVWDRRRRLMKLIDDYDCKLCGSPLDDSLYEFLGYVTKAERASLDAFQVKYVHCKIRCGNCGGVLICADNGMPMRGYYSS